jgi:tetratricopeptide (TPR) repeat protein
MKKLLLLALLLVACGAAAQSLRVEYLEGEVLLSAGGGWRELNPGDVVAQTARIRLGDDGFAELSLGSARLSVSQPGTYLVSDLVAASKKVASWQLGKVVGGKIKTAVVGRSTAAATGARAATMGTRAENAAEPEAAGIEWAEEVESPGPLDQGRSLVEKGRTEEALTVLTKGLPEADPRDRDAFHYYIALAYSQQHMILEALRELEQVNIDPQAQLYPELVLLKGQLLLESLAFDAALALFNDQLAKNPGCQFTQALWILSSFSYRGLGRNDRAREALQKAVRLDAASELGQEAQGLLSQL